MNTRRICVILAVVLGALLVAFTIFDRTAEGQDKQARTKWEYKVIKATEFVGGGIDGLSLEKDLNKLGEDGWECVGTLSEAKQSQVNSIYTQGILVLKRAK